MIDILGMTDVGLVRRENQDAYAVRERTESGHSVCVVCDGMGGYAGGRLASSIAAETFMAELEKRLQPDMTAEALQTVSAQAISMADGAIREAAGRLLSMETLETKISFLIDLYLAV